MVLTPQPPGTVVALDPPSRSHGEPGQQQANDAHHPSGGLGLAAQVPLLEKKPFHPTIPQRVWWLLGGWAPRTWIRG